MAEDLLQEIFMQLWRNPTAFDSNRGALAPWLVAITRNRAIDWLRKRRPETPVADVALSFEPDLASKTELGVTGMAEDSLQEIFIQLWRNPQAFNASRGSLAAWLAVIARNRAIDQLRKKRPEVEAAEIVISVDPELENAADRSLAIEKVRAVLAGMPGEQREALGMAFFEGLTHVEIAGKTGQPLGTIKTRIRSGLLAVRKAFAV